MAKSPTGNVAAIKARLKEGGIRSIDDLARQLDKHSGGKLYPLGCVVHSDYVVCSK